MRTSLEWFDALPAEVRRQVMDKLFLAMRWRSWDAAPETRCVCHAREAVSEIADLLSAAGCEVEEYT